MKLTLKRNDNDNNYLVKEQQKTLNMSSISNSSDSRNHTKEISQTIDITQILQEKDKKIDLKDFYFNDTNFTKENQLIELNLSFHNKFKVFEKKHSFGPWEGSSRRTNQEEQQRGKSRAVQKEKQNLLETLSFASSKHHYFIGKKLSQNRFNNKKSKQQFIPKIQNNYNNNLNNTICNHSNYFQSNENNKQIQIAKTGMKLDIINDSSQQNIVLQNSEKKKETYNKIQQKRILCEKLKAYQNNNSQYFSNQQEEIYNNKKTYDQIYNQKDQANKKCKNCNFDFNTIISHQNINIKQERSISQPSQKIAIMNTLQELKTTNQTQEQKNSPLQPEEQHQLKNNQAYMRSQIGNNSKLSIEELSKNAKEIIKIKSYYEVLKMYQNQIQRGSQERSDQLLDNIYKLYSKDIIQQQKQKQLYHQMQLNAKHKRNSLSSIIGGELQVKRINYQQQPENQIKEKSVLNKNDKLQNQKKDVQDQSSQMNITKTQKINFNQNLTLKQKNVNLRLFKLHNSLKKYQDYQQPNKIENEQNYQQQQIETNKLQEQGNDTQLITKDYQQNNNLKKGINNEKKNSISYNPSLNDYNRHLNQQLHELRQVSMTAQTPESKQSFLQNSIFNLQCGKINQTVPVKRLQQQNYLMNKFSKEFDEIFNDQQQLNFKNISNEQSKQNFYNLFQTATTQQSNQIEQKSALINQTVLNNSINSEANVVDSKFLKRLKQIFELEEDPEQNEKEQFNITKQQINNDNINLKQRNTLNEIRNYVELTDFQNNIQLKHHKDLKKFDTLEYKKTFQKQINSIEAHKNLENVRVQKFISKAPQYQEILNKTNTSYKTYIEKPRIYQTRHSRRMTLNNSNTNKDIDSMNKSFNIIKYKRQDI